MTSALLIGLIALVFILGGGVIGIVGLIVLLLLRFGIKKGLPPQNPSDKTNS